MDRNPPKDVGLAPPRDLMDAVIEEGDTIAYPTGAGSDGSDLVVGVVDEIKDGKDRWRRPCRVLMVRPIKSSKERSSLATAPRRRIWMVSKTIIIRKRGK